VTAGGEAGRAEDDDHVTIAAERLERLVTAITLASADCVDEALDMLADDAPDVFGYVEEGFRQFLHGLRTARRETAAAIEQLEQSRLEVERKLRTIEQQRDEIAELSVPIIDLWEGVLALPLVGRVDAERAARITEALLARVVAARARWVIVDLTGVDLVDAITAGGLVRLTDATELLGAACIVTGIQPGVVESMLALGIPLARLRPQRTLRDGLERCLAARRAELARRR
jgi:rsbT co-antagonist protein RsbR